MKSIIRRLITKKEATTDAGHRQFLSELHALDDIAALEASTRFLSGYGESDRAAQLALLHIDEANHPRLEKLLDQYAKFDKLRPELESRIAEGSYYYQRQIFLSYVQQIELQQLNAHPTPPPESSPYQISLMCGRALHAGLCMIKLRYFQQQAVPAAAWHQMFQVYRLAERLGLTTTPLSIYADCPEKSLATMFAQICMLDSINQSGMTRVQIELTWQLLTKLLRNVQVVDHYEEQHHFYFIDLRKDRGARRMRTLEPSPEYRYWSTDDLSMKIELLSHTQNLPQAITKLGLAEFANNPHLGSLLQQLQFDWSKNGYRRQRRKEERQSTLLGTRVILGLDAICMHLRATADKLALQNAHLTENATPLEERLAKHSVRRSTTFSAPEPSLKNLRWTVTDMSTKGYGATLEKDTEASLSPGMIVILLMDEQKDAAIIGMIKNVSVLASGKKHIGVEILSRKARWVSLSTTQESTPVATGGILSEHIPEFSSLYLPPEEGLVAEPTLLVPRSRFLPDVSYRIRSLNEKSFQRLETVLEGRHDWLRVACPGLL
jgi:cyclic-di-GMP-binding protein